MVFFFLRSYFWDASCRNLMFSKWLNVPTTIKVDGVMSQKSFTSRETDWRGIDIFQFQIQNLILQTCVCEQNCYWWDVLLPLIFFLLISELQGGNKLLEIFVENEIQMDRNNTSVNSLFIMHGLLECIFQKESH